MMRKIKMLALLAAVAVCGGVRGEDHQGWNGLTYSISDEIRPGEITTRFVKAKEYAEANHVPMLIFWGESGCGICNGFEKAIAAEPKLLEWLAKRKYIMTFNINTGTKAEYGLYKEDCKASERFTNNLKSGKLPTMAIYWPTEPDVKKPTCWDRAQNDSRGEVVRFPGRPDYMPFHSAEDKEGGRVFQLMRNMDYFCGSYSSYDGGEFVSSDTEYDRYECEEGTETVAVELVRENADNEAQNKLVVEYPDGSCATNVVNWAVGDSNKVVAVDVTVGGLTNAGQQATLLLKAIDGSAHATNHITCVEQANSSMNPLWKSERIAPNENGIGDVLRHGEWTMDLVRAKALTESTDGDAYTLVLVTGALWCPNCANFERNFQTLSDGPGEKPWFVQWAESNKVALAVIDVPSLTGGTVMAPTLLSKEVGTGYFDKDGKSAQIPKSGLGYLSRKGISDEDAATQLAENCRLARTFTDLGGYIRPEDTEDSSCNGYRPRVPCFYILRKDGTCAARISRFTFPTTPVEADRQWYGNYIKRFDEMLAIAGKGATAHADSTEVENDYPGVHSISLKANGGSASNELCSADLRDTFKLEGFGGNANLAVTVRGESPAKVKVSFWQIGNGSTNVVMVDGAPAVESGKLNDNDGKGITLARDLPAGEYYVKVCAANIGPDAKYLDAEFSPTNALPNNFIAYSVKSEIVLKPSESVATAAAAEGTNVVSIVLEEGATYRMIGLDFNSEVNSNALEWVTGGDGRLFSAKAGGTVELELAADGGEITYQKWVPGTVGFEKSAIDAKETDDVNVAYRRAGGSSGSVTVRVSLNLDETDFFYDYAPDAGYTSKMLPRFKINGVSTTNWSETVEWPDDGRPLEACASNILVTAGEFESQRISQYFGPGKVVFDLEIVEQTEAGVFTNTVDNGRMTINFTDSDTPSAGRVQVSGCDREWAKELTVYAREDEEVKVFLSRIDAAEGPVSADFKKSVESVVLGGDYNNLLGVTWKNRDMLPKTVTVTNLPSAGKSVKLTLTAVSPFKVDSSAGSVTIVSVAADAPAFEQEMDGQTIYRYVAVSNGYKVIGTKGGALKFTKVSGKLPSGLKAAWNGDTENPAMVITGVPTGKDGTSASAVFQVTETRGNDKVPGMTIVLDFRLVDPAVSGGPAGGPLNAACVKSRTFKDLMVLQRKDDGTVELFGTLQLTLPANGKASAKLLCDEGTLPFKAKSWSAIESASDGDYSCELVCSKSGYSDWAFDVEAGTNGSVSATLVIDGERKIPVTHDGVLWSKDHPATDCAGYYTVTFTGNKLEGGIVDITGPGKDYASEGTAYLTLTMSESQAKSGTMKWAGLLPNGTKVSGSSVLSECDAETVFLPFIKSAKKDVFAGVLAIERGATAKEEESDCWTSVSFPMVDDDPLLPRWVHAEKSTKTEKGDFTVRFKPYGGIYDSTLDLDCCCTNQRATTTMDLSVLLPTLGSDFYGTFADVEPITVEVKNSTITRKDSTGGANKITLSFNRKTGVVSGKFDLYYGTEGKKLSAKYQGVVQLGFGGACGCETDPQPFVNGSWYVTDKIETVKGTGKYISVKRGGRMEIEVPKVQ